MGNFESNEDESFAGTREEETSPWLPFWLIVGAGSLLLLLAYGASQVEKLGFELGRAHAEEITVAGFAHDAMVPYWDEAEQAWRDPFSRRVWWAATPGWVEADGQAHYWWDGGWHWRNGEPWRDLSVPVWSASAGVEQWRWLVGAYFPAWAVDYVLVVMDCESNGRPWVTGIYGHIGLMQMAPMHGWRVGWRDMYDPATNIEAAAHLWREQGWAPWVCA